MFLNECVSGSILALKNIACKGSGSKLIWLWFFCDLIFKALVLLYYFRVTFCFILFLVDVNDLTPMFLCDEAVVT